MNIGMQLVFLFVLLAIGSAVLLIRRKAKGSKSFYKLVLLLLGILVAESTSGMIFDKNFLSSLSVILMILLMFELSIRLNPDNTLFKKKDLYVLLGMLLVNVVILTIAASFFLRVGAMQLIIFSILMSGVEYFLVDDLRREGDLANPMILLFTFSLLYYFGLGDSLYYNAVAFLQYILIGIGTGVLTGIIVFKSLKNVQINWVHETGLVFAAIALYILTGAIGGSGLFAVMVLGTFFGNSFVRKKNELKSLSPFIFKSLEILIFLMLGFVASAQITLDIIFVSACLYAVYAVLRFIIISSVYKHYSMHNKLLLTFAPKGVTFAVAIMVMSYYGIMSTSLVSTMITVLAISLVASTIFEYIEYEKIHRLDRWYEIIKSLRYGRKRDLRHKHKAATK